MAGYGAAAGPGTPAGNPASPPRPAGHVAGHLADRFVELAGRQPAGIWGAPGRVNLIGEYTDLNEGHVLPLAIPQRTRAVAAARADRRLSVRSLQQSGGAEAEVEADLDDRDRALVGWAAYPFAVAHVLEDAGLPIGGADLLLDSDVPVGAGLSSSAALECAVGLALCELAGVELAAMELARLAQRAENDYVGVPCGIMDQAASMCCTTGNALLLDTRRLELRQVPFPLGRAGLSLLVVDTRVRHSLASSAYADRRRACEQAAELLGVKALRDVPFEDCDEALERLEAAAGEQLMRRARHVLSEQRRVLEVVARLEEGDLAAVGALLVEGHRSLRDDFEVSSPELDTVVDAAVAAGALGARMTGAGFGGSAIVLAETAAIDGVRAAVLDAFSQRGYRPPASFTVAASAGACREA